VAAFPPASLLAALRLAVAALRLGLALRLAFARDRTSALLRSPFSSRSQVSADGINGMNGNHHHINSSPTK